MLKLAFDEGFNGHVVRAIRQRQPDLDTVRVQDAGLGAASDPDILAWAASEGRILLSHDRRTMIPFAYERVDAGLPMPGLFILRDQPHEIGQMVEAILLVAHCSTQEEWNNRVQFLPL